MPNNIEITPYTGRYMAWTLKYFHCSICTKFAAMCDLDMHASNIVPASHMLSC